MIRGRFGPSQAPIGRLPFPSRQFPANPCGLGEPGVFSARYAGKDGDDAANNQKLINALSSQSDRGAHYVCALVMVQSANDPEPLIVQTRWHGTIIDQAKGQNGFGYDPHFYLPELYKTAAELEPEEKNLVSHRGQALRELILQLKNRA